MHWVSPPIDYHLHTHPPYGCTVSIWRMVACRLGSLPLYMKACLLETCIQALPKVGLPELYYAHA